MLLQINVNVSQIHPVYNGLRFLKNYDNTINNKHMYGQVTGIYFSLASNILKVKIYFGVRQEPKMSLRRTLWHSNATHTSHNVSVSNNTNAKAK